MLKASVESLRIAIIFQNGANKIVDKDTGVHPVMDFSPPFVPHPNAHYIFGLMGGTLQEKSLYSRVELFENYGH